MCGSIPDSKQCKAKKQLPLGPFGLVPSQLHEFVPRSAVTPGKIRSSSHIQPWFKRRP